MRLAIIIILLTVLPSYRLTVLAQSLQFYREDIVFKMSKNQATTDAQYHFCNTNDKEIKTTLFYPFPENTMEQIDTLVIWNMKTNEVVPFREGKSGVFFGISVEAYGQACYHIYYQQWLKENHFTYILTSTKSWGRPLELANFELQVPDSITVDSLSYVPDSTDNRGGIRHYYWQKKDFLPEKDFEIVFH